MTFLIQKSEHRKWKSFFGKKRKLLKIVEDRKLRFKAAVIVVQVIQKSLSIPA
jgi:hypothetical protein